MFALNFSVMYSTCFYDSAPAVATTDGWGGDDGAINLSGLEIDITAALISDP